MGAPLSHDPAGAAQHQILNAEYDGSGNLIYLGAASPSTADADQAWLIAFFTYSAGGLMLTKRFALGTLYYNQRWTDRASLAYA